MPLKLKKNTGIVKNPCPHCSNLCSPNVDYCSKCGEPLPKIKPLKDAERDEFIKTYSLKNPILKSIELEIKQEITLNAKLDPNSIGYLVDNGKIIGLSLFKCGLEFLPNHVFKLKDLKQLFLKANYIFTLPSNIADLINLEYLDMRLNELSELPASIGVLTKLKILKLSFNNLEKIPDSIGELKSLRKLDLSYNKLKNIPDSLSKLDLLCELNLRKNNLINVPKEIEK